jgi:SRSO17 transposase
VRTTPTPNPSCGPKTRRAKAGIPDGIEFQTKPHIALDQVRQAIADGVPKGVALADAGYGNDTAFHSGLTELDLQYAVGVQGSTTVWASGTQPLPARTWSGRGRRTKLLRRDSNVKPIKVSELAKSLARRAWKTVRWREGTKGDLVSRFAAVRIRPSHRDYWRAEPWPEEWLLIEWPEGEDAPIKYWLSTLPAGTQIATLVDTAKLRWRIERDFQDHAALSIAAYGFLVAERSPIPPSGILRQALIARAPTPNESYRPRGHAPPA